MARPTWVPCVRTRRDLARQLAPTDMGAWRAFSAHLLRHLHDGGGRFLVQTMDGRGHVRPFRGLSSLGLCYRDGLRLCRRCPAHSSPARQARHSRTVVRLARYRSRRRPSALHATMERDGGAVSACDVRHRVFVVRERGTAGSAQFSPRIARQSRTGRRRMGAFRWS